MADSGIDKAYRFNFREVLLIDLQTYIHINARAATAQKRPVYADLSPN